MNYKELDIQDMIVIKESLEYSKMYIRGYDQYPNYEMKRDKLNQIEKVLEKVRQVIRG